MLRVNQLRGFNSPASDWARAPIADQARGLAINGYSFRRLRFAYTGSAVKLRRSSDNAELDFGFTPQGYVDISAINTWLGGGSAKVITWYDQIGSTNYSGTGSALPDLVISGSQVWANTISNSAFNGGPSLSAWTSLVVGRPIAPGSWRTLFWTANNIHPALIESGSTNFGEYDSAFGQFGSQTWAGSENASFYFDFMTNPVTASKNNGSAGSAGTFNSSRAPNLLGNSDGFDQQFGRIDEVVFFNADLSTDLRTALNANQRLFYGI